MAHKVSLKGSLKGNISEILQGLSDAQKKRLFTKKYLTEEETKEKK